MRLNFYVIKWVEAQVKQSQKFSKRNFMHKTSTFKMFLRR